MINGYKKLDVTDTPSENCMVYKAQKDGELFQMYEFEDGKMTDS